MAELDARPRLTRLTGTREARREAPIFSLGREPEATPDLLLMQFRALPCSHFGANAQCFGKSRRENVPDLNAHRREDVSAEANGDGRSAGMAFGIVAVAHFIFCCLPLLLLSGVSLAFIAPYWPLAAGVLAVMGVIGFVWYFKRGCATCPRNEGRCPVHPSPKT
jgi:hypothetical protein